MKTYQHDFIKLAMDRQVLRFGEFTLKSKRISPYFFNMGLFHDGESLAKVGEYFADAIQQSQLDFDILFGPAYKGIPLVSTTAIALAQKHQRNLPYAFDRKEAKDHGEGGVIVGAPLKGKVLLIDDVITEGKAKRDAAALIKQQGATLCGIVIALDRQERGQGALSTVQELEQAYNIPVINIITLEHIIEYLSTQPNSAAQLKPIKSYRTQYGIN